jgi:hypothetical protein
MIPKSGCRFSEKIMLKQQAKAKYRFDQKSFRFSGRDSQRNEKDLGSKQGWGERTSKVD